MTGVLRDSCSPVFQAGIGEYAQRSRSAVSAPSVCTNGARVTHVPERRSAAAALEAGDAVNLVLPADLEAVEVYRGASEVPGEFAGSDAICGAVVLWTKGALGGGPTRR